ncbi:ABC transporter permease subunit [Pseudoflavitalea rhizosphaerae]|uniref:ABC transporter permease subunit n=1 Tax=Pseudoflavitalea rhizosphaerae TaxID=1884793 RepID=UPI000F8C4FB4|nr:Gldg family protein [Pseudoflavitalea rhizosphaerae]
MKTILRISRAELRNLVYSPVAWFLAVVFMVQCAFFYNRIVYAWARMQELGMKTAKFKGFDLSLTKSMFLNPDGMFVNAMSNLYLFIPLLTMGLLSREVNSGSIKLLYSSPIKTRQIVFGKYLAMMVFNLVLIAIIGFFMVSAGFNIKSVDYGLLIAASIGFYLLVCAYAAIGLFMSSLTNYQIVSAIGTFVVVLVLSRIGGLWQKHDFVRDLTYFLSISGRAEKMLNGLITTKDLFYFFAVICMFLAFTLLKLRSVREVKPWYVKAARYSGITVVVLLLGYITSRPALIGYWDTTATQANTIHPRVQKIVKALGKEPLEVTLYTNLMGKNGSLGLPENRNNYLSELWEYYVRFKPDIEFKYEYYYDAKPDHYLFRAFPGKNIHEIAKELAKSMDLNLNRFKTPDQMKQILDLEDEDYGLVMQLKYKGRTTFLRTFVDYPWPGEEHVAAALARLQFPKMPTMLFTTGNLERDPNILGERGYSMSTTAKLQRVSLINNGIDIDTINLENKDIPYDSMNIAALVLADPKTELSETVKRKIQEYIDKGGNFMLLGEPRKEDIVNPVLKPLGVQFEKGVMVQVSKHNAPDMIIPFLTNTASDLAEEAMLLKLKSKKIDSLYIRSETVLPITTLDSSVFTVSPVTIAMPDVWLKKGVLVRDSVPPVFTPAEGDIKNGAFQTSVELTRKINNREQRIFVSGDADLISNKFLGGDYFGRAIYSWLDNNEYPVYAPKPQYKDNLFLITPETADLLITINTWIIPAILAIIGTVIIIRRKRK